MSRLTEAVNYDFYKDKIDKKTFDWLCSLDPTSTHKYSRWIVECFIREYIDLLYGNIKKKYAWSIENPNYGSLTMPDFPIPFRMLFLDTAIYQNFSLDTMGNAIIGFYERRSSQVYEDLQSYIKLSNKKRFTNPDDPKKDNPKLYNIMNIKLFADLWGWIHRVYDDDLKEIEENEPIAKEEREIWYNDDTYLVVRPLTHKASKKYGAHTKWCTTEKDSPGTFNEYSHQGPLIIIINKTLDIEKNNMAKVQIHVPSDQWMDAANNEIDRTEFIEGLPQPLKTAIYEHTHYFLFCQDKEAIVKKIFDSPDIWKKVQARLLRESFFNKACGYGGNGELDDITTVLKPPMLQYVFNEEVWDDVINNDDYSYGYGYDHPWEFLPKDTEPAFKEDLTKCEGCDGEGYAVYYRDPADHEWYSSIPKEVFLNFSARMQKENPEVYVALLRLYKYNEETTDYDPDPMANLVELGKLTKTKCPFCHGSGLENYDEEDPELYSDEQRETAAQESESKAVDSACDEWYHYFIRQSVNWNHKNERERLDRIADNYIRNYLPYEKAMKESCEALVQLIALYEINIDDLLNPS